MTFHALNDAANEMQRFLYSQFESEEACREYLRDSVNVVNLFIDNASMWFIEGVPPEISNTNIAVALAAVRNILTDGGATE